MTFREKSAQLHDYLQFPAGTEMWRPGGINPKEIHANLGNSRSSTEKSMVCLEFFLLGSEQSTWKQAAVSIDFWSREMIGTLSTYRGRGSFTHWAA